MRSQLKIGSLLSWIVAWLLVVAAIAMTLLFGPTLWTWWVGLALMLPLVGLVAWRQDRTSSGHEYHGQGDAGPWGPPPSL